MPLDNPDPSDPMVLVGIELPGDAESMRDMAYTFSEEFARMAYSEKRLLSIFQSPFYRAAHDAYKILGKEAIKQIIRECVEVWGTARSVDRDGPTGSTQESSDC